jgi:hypothetical protein
MPVLVEPLRRWLTELAYAARQFVIRARPKLAADASVRGALPLNRDRLFDRERQR